MAAISPWTKGYSCVLIPYLFTFLSPLNLLDLMSLKKPFLQASVVSELHLELASSQR